MTSWLRPGAATIHALARVALLLAAAWAWGGGAWAQAAADAPRQRLLIGAAADHLVDTNGRLTIAEAAADRALFTPADGTPANRGVSPGPRAALWLRFTLPARATLGSADSWVLSLQETRVRRASLYAPASGEWRVQEWDPKASRAAGQPATRYPAFWVDAADEAGREFYLRVETTSSMRALLWLETGAAFADTYGQRSLAFGALVGALAALFAYLLAIGSALRDPVLLRLSVLVLAFVAYVAADRAILETAVIPGAFELSRIVSLAGSLLVFAAWLSFESCYLEVRRHRPRLARAVATAVAALVILAAEVVLEFAAGIRVIRLYSPYLGLASLAGGIALALAMARPEPRRAGLFLLCWLPAIVGGMARLLLDAAGGATPHPLVLNGVYFGAGLSLLTFGIVASLDIQARERRLLRAAQASEARVRGFAGSASDSFWETDAGGRLAYLAGRLDGESLGLSLGDGLVEGLGRNLWESDRAGLEALDRSLHGPHAFRAAALTVRDPSGAARHLTFSGTPVFEADGSYGGHRGTFSDVTRETLMGERERQQQTMAALGQLAGSVAHEINNLLHPILNLTRRVRGSLDAGDERAYQLGIVEDATLRAREIVSGILAAARPRPEGSPVAPLAEGLAKATDAVRPVLPSGIVLDVRIEPLAGYSVATGEVLQVVSNLVSNAVHALDRNGRIDIALSAGSHGDGAVLCIADEGAGMDAATRRRAFEPFFTTRGRDGGTGLGLPMVYGIVTGWGASIDIVSEPGRGTKFVITLPRSLERKGDNTHAPPAAGPGDR